MVREDNLIDLGGGAGTEVTATDGLSLFKKGFANAERRNHLVGKVLDPEAYAALSGGGGAAFFPAYRAPVASAPAQDSGDD